MQTTSESGARKYTGGCHCGRVRFEVEMEVTGAISCNCSICSKRGWLLTFVPVPSFKLIAGEDELTDYQFNKKMIHHLFCTTCGTASFGKGSDGQGNEMIAVNLRCVDDLDLKSIPITEYNGKNI
ncbi:MAG: hypothetical protein RLZZ76_281 [Candidatus Parcubacteria bacterium]